MDATDEQFQRFVTACKLNVDDNEIQEWSFDDRVRLINHGRKFGVDIFAELRAEPNENNSANEQKTIRQGDNEPASEDVPAVHLHADKDLKPETAQALGKLVKAAYKAVQDGTLVDLPGAPILSGWANIIKGTLQQGQPSQSETAICEGCGAERGLDNWAILPTKVNLRDGSSREILFCDQPCCEFWDDTEPGDWVELASGEEVQLALWRCTICDGVYDHDMVKLMIDTEDNDSDVVVCSLCRKKEKGRFKAKEQ